MDSAAYTTGQRVKYRTLKEKENKRRSPGGGIMRQETQSKNSRLAERTKGASTGWEDDGINSHRQEQPIQEGVVQESGLY